MNKKLIIWMLGIALSLPLAFSCNNPANNNNNNSEMNNENMNNNNMNGNNSAAAPAFPTTDSPTVHAIGENMSEMHYDMTSIYIKSGDKIHLTLINDASDPSMIHNIVITKGGTMQNVVMDGIKAKATENTDYLVPNDPNVIAHTPLAKPHETVSVDFTAPAPGTYDFFCSYPGHYTKMNGKLIVE